MFETLQPYVDKLRICLDYIPLALITILFIAETEIEKHAMNFSCQTAIMVFTVVVFIILITKLKQDRLLAFVIVIFLWLTLVYLKHKYVITAKSI